MKRLFLIMLGVVLAASPAVRAQSLDGIGLSVEKVSIPKLEKAIEKSNADIADPKKSAKAATWIARGQAFLDADTKPVNSLFTGLEESMLKLSFGDAPSQTVTYGSTEYTEYTYEHFKVYVNDGKVQFYAPTTVIDAGALDKSFDAFAKAYDLDSKTEKKVSEGLTSVRNKSLEDASRYYAQGEYVASADNFRRAYRASVHPSINHADTVSLFYAGFLGTLGADYKNALEDLNKALEYGYEADGETYYYKFHCLYNLGDEQGALETLQHAVALYPNNDSIIEGLLTLYSTGDQDPTDLIPLVLRSIDQNPTNAGLRLGLARVYDKLGQEDNAIESAGKAAELAPGDFFANYFHGLFIVKKGDSMDEEFRNMIITSTKQYQEELAKVNEAYSRAIVPLEKAFEINPEEVATVELLKNLTFRLRENEEMAAKNKKYDALYKSMLGE